MSAQGKPEGFYGDEIRIEFNPMSGCVFLVDADYNAAMMNGDKLETWLTCPYCGHEGFKEDMDHDAENEECSRYLREIGVPALGGEE